jgi:hypothetical protein
LSEGFAKKPSLALAAIGALATVLAACVSQPAATQSTHVAASELAQASASAGASAMGGPLAGLPLLGTYESLVRANGFQTDSGQWDIRIDAQGVTFIKPNGSEFSPGAVKEVTADEITFAADFGCPTQSGAAAEGRYRWRLQGTSLTFTEVSDSCGERANTLTQDQWDLKP